MKIEMLEQMFASYLKHYEGCLITQTNWSPSVSLLKQVDLAEKSRMQQLVDEIRSTSSLNIFKKSTFDQFISQCEIDVVGLKDCDNKRTVYLYDTAFHEDGLNYKDTAPRS